MFLVLDDTYMDLALYVLIQEIILNYVDEYRFIAYHASVKHKVSMLRECTKASTNSKRIPSATSTGLIVDPHQIVLSLRARYLDVSA